MRRWTSERERVRCVRGHGSSVCLLSGMPLSGVSSMCVSACAAAWRPPRRPSAQAGATATRGRRPAPPLPRATRLHPPRPPAGEQSGRAKDSKIYRFLRARTGWRGATHRSRRPPAGRARTPAPRSAARTAVVYHQDPFDGPAPTTGRSMAPPHTTAFHLQGVHRRLGRKSGCQDASP